MAIKVTLPGGTQIEVPGDNSVEQIRELVDALGLADVAGAEASVAPNGDVTFAQQTGGAKGV